MTADPRALTEAPAGPAPLASPAFARAYWITMRPYLLFVSGFTGILGLALGPALPWPLALVLVTVFFFLYGFGQALTDCFQLDTDARSAPYRPLVRGAVRRRDVLAVSVAGLAASAAVLAAFHPLNLVLGPAAAAGLATYTAFKRRWWAGPFYNAWIVAALVALGWASAAGAARAPLAWRPEIGWAMATAFFAYADFVLAGYFKDVSADRVTGYRTLPVAFGMRAAAWVSDGFALAGLACAGVLVARVAGGSAPWAALLLLAAAAAAAGRAHLRLHRVREETQAHRAIAWTVHAYLLLLAAAVTALAPAWLPVLVLGLLAYLHVLRGRPVQEQI